MLPSELYRQHLDNYGLSADDGQLRVLAALDRLHRELNGARPARRLPWNWFARKNRPQTRGIYLWGGVGRGKTMLMDILYDSLEGATRRREHFHRFMLHVHQRCRRLKHVQHPLRRIAGELAGQARLLCLDEFHVNDITDAMLLAGLLEALFDEGVALVTTSNIAPDQLYAGGLQRARFLPAIELIKRHTQVVELKGAADYRLRALRKDGTYHWPLDENAARHLRSAFEALTSHARWAERDIEINGRAIPVHGQAEGAVWFGFDALCDSPRSQADYLEIARQHHSVFVSDVPVLDDRRADAARRFLNLLDVFYDNRVKLIVSAAAPIEKLYRGERLAFEFQRATSRLIEMQSEQYLSRTHRG